MTKPIRRDETKELLTDTLIGAAAGAIGVWALDKVSTYMYAHERDELKQREQAARPNGASPSMAFAEQISDNLRLDPDEEQLAKASMTIHYMLGIAPGAVYSILWHRSKFIGSTYGAAYGLMLFLMMDEAVNTALGTTDVPQKFPKQAHLRGLVSHLALGVVTDVVIRAFRKYTS